MQLVPALLAAPLAAAAFVPAAPFLAPYFDGAIEQLAAAGEAPLVDSDALQDRIDTENLQARAAALYRAANESVAQYGHPTRVIGSRGHAATIDYIERTLNDLDGYYTVKRQSLTAVLGRIDNFTLSDADTGLVPPAEPLRLTPGTPGGQEIVARVVPVGGHGCLGSEYGAAKDQIALVVRGKCSFGEKSEFAGLAGAKALLVWDPEQEGDELTPGTLSVPLEHHVPTVMVDREWAEGIVAAAATGEDAAALGGSTSVALLLDADVFAVDTLNVVAETVGGDHDNVVMLGAHSDSVEAGPGINDDGSGTLTLLEVATQLAQFRVTNAVRFAWWAAEEEGLIGSLYYTENIPPSEASKIRMFQDYDMLASPNYVYSVYDSNDEENPVGSAALRDLYIDYYKAHGLEYELNPFDGRSDYVGFTEIGVPAGGVDTGAEARKTRAERDKFGGDEGEQLDPCYHEACDNLDNVAYDAWSINTRLVAHTVATFARSLDGFPARVDTYTAGGRTNRRRVQAA